ncbi:MAG: tRNA (N(6)-L-threonylcarbamoyladenosine(37)-C(2))-methylthiotransferase [Nanoarchaeota archaeon]
MVSIHFITQGCAANQADSEVMAGILAQEGHQIIGNEGHADLIVFNTCTVKGPTESFFKTKLKKLEQEGKTIILAGCIPQAEKSFTTKHSIIGTYALEHITKVVNETLKGNLLVKLERENRARLNLPKCRLNPVIEIVPILHGCLGSCSFCKTKHARGELYSYPIEDIVRHISKAVEDGAKEIWLTSQDNSAYGKDIGSSLPALLKAICTIPRAFMLRVGMGNPEHMLPMLDELVAAYQHPKIYKFLHIPLQSGSDKVLKDMNREYTVAEFKEVVNAFKEAIPSISIATDIICGYPTENDQDFEYTKDVVRWAQPERINIARFWPRPNTPAAQLKQLTGDILKRRTKEMTAVYQEVAQQANDAWIGWKGTVLVTEKGKGNTMVARNEAYKQVIIDQVMPLGEELEVNISFATPFDLRTHEPSSPRNL